jgi:hypothetical protein
MRDLPELYDSPEFSGLGVAERLLTPAAASWLAQTECEHTIYE